MTKRLPMLDPTSGLVGSLRERLEPPPSLDGVTIALLDINKPRGSVVLDQLERRLTALGASVRRYIKPIFARIAPIELRTLIASECSLVIEGLAD